MINERKYKNKKVIREYLKVLLDRHYVQFILIHIFSGKKSQILFPPPASQNSYLRSRRQVNPHNSRAKTMSKSIAPPRCLNIAA